MSKKYICDVRDSYKGKNKVILRFFACEGIMDYKLFLPKEKDELAKNYFFAEIYNVLSSFGGEKLEIFCSYEEVELANDVINQFYINEKRQNRLYYGKAVNVAERMSGESFKIEVKDIKEFKIEKNFKIDNDTSEFMVPNIKAKTIIGMDIGGTDIKAVLVKDEKIVKYTEYDWFPAVFTDCNELKDPICSVVKELAGNEKIDAIGLCFPDVVIKNKIVGGEVYKTRGIREHKGNAYDENFKILTDLNNSLETMFQCKVEMTNDGPMAAFTALVEQKAGGCEVNNGIFAHTLGTELGTGWVTSSGAVPEIPLEVYNYIIDLGSDDEKKYTADDIRSINNFNTLLAGTLQKYASQSGVFRLAMKYFDEDMKNELFKKGFIEKQGQNVVFVTKPKDMRKPFLEYIMNLANENEIAKEIFREIGEYLAVTFKETVHILNPKAKVRTQFGRLVKHKNCYNLIVEGAKRIVPDIEFVAADENMANTPLMKQLAQHKKYTVAQFAQAIGAVYFSQID